MGWVPNGPGPDWAGLEWAWTRMAGPEWVGLDWVGPDRHGTGIGFCLCDKTHILNFGKRRCEAWVILFFTICSLHYLELSFICMKIIWR